ncbi:MAG TPA: carboxypeptidase regulatory-like domain-containing protein [Candidatus Acidoferrales bacterium]|nr:carboxypeptidase regulatory-like domain-containing protein [Candidatus Acidoferrales bacterium]
MAISLTAFVMGALFCVPASAQVNSAEISGRVEDASGGGIGGATVTVKTLETGATKTVTTDSVGNFEVLSLPVGPQEVRAAKDGFKSTVRTGINLEVGQNATVNLQLEIGEVIQEVTVQGDAPVVNTTTASISGMVGEREIKELPLNGRSFDNLITLNPGAINYSALKSANTSTSNGNTFSVAGRRTAENLFLLNGIEYLGSSQLANTPGGVSGELLGIDAVREFNVLTNNYSAEYGKRAGAQVSVVTQSGTNNIHGSVFEFLRNSVLDARNYFTQAPVSPSYQQNQFGAALGGPLQKNRWFLFGNYEGFRQALMQSSVSVVPDAQARTGSLPNPATGVYSPVSGLNPAMLQYMAFWPQPNGPELTSPTVKASGTAYSYNYPKQYERENFGTARTDYVLGSNDTLSASYTIDDGFSRIPLVDPLFASGTELRMQVASLQETHTFSPETLNTARFGFSRAGFNLDSIPLTSIPANLDFVTGAGPGGITVGGGLSTTAGSGTITAAGPNNAAGVWNRRNLFTYSDDVQLTRGRHQVSVGVWFQRLQDNEFSASRQAGVAAFSSLMTFLQGNITGAGASFQVVPKATEIGWRSFFGAWYADDTIRLTPRLTVELGLRHEFTTGWNAVQDRAADYVTDSNNVLVTAPVVGSKVFTTNNAKKLFSPRVSLAYDPFGNGKTAIRAGFGTYYSVIDNLAFLLNSLPPYNGSYTFTGALSSIAPVSPSFSEPTCGPGVAPPCATYAPQGVQPDAKTPTVEEWTFGIEQQLNQSTAFRISYLGSHGYHGFIAVDPNSIPAQICASATCTTGGTSATHGTVNQGQQYIPVGSRPNQYLGAGFFWYNEGNSSYNALETDVNHRFGHGLEFRANYTWSKNLDMNSALTIAQSANEPQMIMNRNQLSRDWGPSALNAAQQVSISGRYELPIGPGKHWLNATHGIASKLAGGWQINGISTFLSGFPLTPLVGSNRSGDGDIRNPDRPNYAAGFSGPIVTHNPAQWYNPAAFALPTIGTYGDVGRGVLRGPGLANVDFSIFKTTTLTERTTLQFRAEAFNIFNRVNFGAPSATVFSGASTSLQAGNISTLATNPRQIQFGLKVLF